MNSQLTTPPSFFTFGSMSLGSDLGKIQEHVRIARRAMDARVWFHSSPTYNRGFTYMILRMAFEEARQLVPPMIIKIRCGVPRLLRFEVEDALRRLNIECIDVAQLVFTETGGAEVLVDDFVSGGPIKAVCDQLRAEGKVRQFCPQVDRASSPLFVPLAKWSMLLTGNYRCITPTEPQSIRDAVHGDLTRSQAIYDHVDGIARRLGADPADQVPFAKYAKAAESLLKPSSAARAVAAGAPFIERVDLLVKLISHQLGSPSAEIDRTVETVDQKLNEKIVQGGSGAE